MRPEEALQELADATAEDLPRLLRQAMRMTGAALLQRANALGYDDVTMAHGAVFTNLDAGGTRIVDLAARAEMTRQGMSALVRELEAAGYVDVRPDPADGRASLVRLTKRGVAFCADAATAMRELEAEWNRALGPGGLTTLYGALHTLIATGDDTDL